jgi:acyl-CoA synthetase (AMP-forming)/AMP-acid ligase II
MSSRADISAKSRSVGAPCFVSTGATRTRLPKRSWDRGSAPEMPATSTTKGSDPRIREAAAVGRPDDELGEVPAVFIVGVPGLSDGHVRQLFHGVLAEYKHPRDLFFVDELPKSALGKVQRSVLRAWRTDDRS